MLKSDQTVVERIIQAVIATIKALVGALIGALIVYAIWNWLGTPPETYWFWTKIILAGLLVCGIFQALSNEVAGVITMAGIGLLAAFPVRWLWDAIATAPPYWYVGVPMAVVLAVGIFLFDRFILEK